MRKIKRTILTLLLVTLLGSLLSGSALAKEIGTGGKVKLDGGTVQYGTEMSLRESLTPSDPASWTPVYGNLANGYTMVLSGTVGETVYLDVASINPAPANGDYPFYLDPVRVPANFWNYWALEGVVAGATDWQGVMWEIINGDLPIFYLRVSDTGSQLIDGLAWQTQQMVLPARVSADYPLYTYNFEGLVGSENVVVGITYTHEVIPSLRIGGVEPEEIVIDGCGYVDVTIHLENVYNLYAVDLSLTFDQNFVEVVDQLTDEIANPGVNLLPIEPWDDPATAYTVSNQANNSTGTIRFIASLLNTQAPITGGLDVATIRLRAKDLGESKLSITGMELSDRDGYLVGVPLTTPVEYPVTTQFTAAGGLDLGITRLDASTVQLNWPAKSTALVQSYTLHRSTLPYFTPGTGTVYQTLTNDGSTATFNDPVLGNVVDNYFYTMQITCSSGLVSPYAWQVGKFEYMMYELFDNTDFTWVGLVLETEESLTHASDLVDHIEQNSNGTVTVTTVTEWTQGQNFSLYRPSNPTGTFDFPLSIGRPYRVEINISGVTNGDVIWAQVGKLPPIDVFSYKLYELFDNTDFTWVLIPLNLYDITTASLLANHVISNSAPTVEVTTIVNWTGSSQNNTLYRYSSGTVDFLTRFGYPYRLEINVTSGTYSIWP